MMNWHVASITRIIRQAMRFFSSLARSMLLLFGVFNRYSILSACLVACILDGAFLCGNQSIRY